MTSSPYFDIICNLPSPTDIFAQAVHPTQPQILIGLASGHVYAYKLPSEADDEKDRSDERFTDDQTVTTPKSGGGGGILSQRRRSSTASLNGLGSIEILWKTRRHKGSCRSLCYSHDGLYGYSAGTDGIVKVFDSQDGKVTSKLALPEDKDGEPDGATQIHALSPQTLLIATDSGALHVLTLTQGGRVVDQIKTTYRPHGDEHVADLVVIPPSEGSTSGFSRQWITVGGSTLAVMDLHKGVVATSEDQDEELLSIAFVDGLRKGGTSVGQKVIVGQADGVVSLWERGVWGDLDDRIVIDRTGNAVDTLTVVPSQFVPKGKLKHDEKIVAAGMEDGTVRFLRIGRNAVLHEWILRHEHMDGVIGLDFDASGQMVSSGGQTTKVWAAARSESPTPLSNGHGKHDRDVEEDTDSSEGEESSVGDDGIAFEANDSDENVDQEHGKRKKRKRNNRSGGQALAFSGNL